jgi:hypothetical protein
MVAGPFPNDIVTRIGDGKYRLTRTTENGNALECAIALDRKQPYANIQVMHAGQNRPSLRIESLELNANMDQDEFLFPKKDELAEKTCLRELPDGAMASSGGGLTVLMAACYARAAIRKPEMREAITRTGFYEIDWNGVEEKDKRVSAMLRDALKTAPPEK